MDSPVKDKRIQAHWNNNSRSSLHTHADAATFHSAADIHNSKNSQHVELRPINNNEPTKEVQATKMTRKDSGFSEVPTLHNSGPSSRRTSTSTSTSRRTSPSKTKRRAHQATNSYSARPGTRRASKSSVQSTQLQQFTSQRPGLPSRHTVPYPSTPANNVVPQFFHFPSFPTPDSSPEPHTLASEPQEPPQPTVHYWTSDDTRRLEYAAIDAASRGIRGFVTRLVPDCMLPKEFRRTKFCRGDEGSEAGSVRRYRLDLPDETEVEKSQTTQRVNFLRRWSASLKTTTS